MATMAPPCCAAMAWAPRQLKDPLAPSPIALHGRVLQDAIDTGCQGGRDCRS